MNLPNFLPVSSRASIRVAVASGATIAFVSLTMLHAHASNVSSLTSSKHVSATALSASAPGGASSIGLVNGSSPTVVAPLQGAASQASVAKSTVVQPENAELDGLVRETLVLEARLKNETLKRDIRKVQRDFSSSAIVSGMPPAEAIPSNTAVGAPTAPPKVASDWVLIGTGAFDGRQSATISVNGAARDVRVGDTIDGWTVKSILAERVTLGRGRAIKTVGM